MRRAFCALSVIFLSYSAALYFDLFCIDSLFFFILLRHLSTILNFSKNLQAVFFDFDGVLVDSVPLKTKAYADIFQPYGEKAVKAVLDYHQKHKGIDRYKKISYVSEKLDLGLTRAKLEQTAAQFSALVKEEIIAKPFVQGALDLLVQLRSAKIKLFIVSAAPQGELREIVQKKISVESIKASHEKSADYFFEKIFGSPQSKLEILKKSLEEYSLDPSKCIFIGDSLCDFKVAQSVGMFFLGLECSNDKSTYA